jgi:hypothetical protein
MYSLFHVEQNIIYTFMSKKSVIFTALQLQSDKEIRDTENPGGRYKNKIAILAPILTMP